MIKGIYASGSGMQPRMMRLEVLANNIANANTTGFKKDNLFVQVMKNAGLATVQGAGDLRGLDIKEFTDFTEGSFAETKNPLDLAIQGNGFFAVETPQGVRYTRNGNFSLRGDGTLVSALGCPVLGTSGPIQVPAPKNPQDTNLTIDEFGVISAGPTIIGKLRVVNYDNLTQLKKDGASMFMSEVPPKEAEMNGTTSVVRQGYLEESNVEGIDEMIQLVELTRSFETDQRTIQAQDTTLERAMDVGRV